MYYQKNMKIQHCDRFSTNKIILGSVLWDSYARSVQTLPYDNTIKGFSLVRKASLPSPKISLILKNDLVAHDVGAWSVPTKVSK